jgi:hypothetical protein
MSERNSGYGPVGVPGCVWRIVVWFVAAVALSGCDGDQERLSKAEYQARILAVVEDSAEPTALYTDLVVDSRPQEDCAAGVAALQDQVDALVERVAALQPPERVQAIHDDFVAAARASADRIGEVQQEVANGEMSCGTELNGALYGMSSTKEAERAIARLESQGYRIFGD